MALDTLLKTFLYLIFKSSSANFSAEFRCMSNIRHSRATVDTRLVYNAANEPIHCGRHGVLLLRERDGATSLVKGNMKVFVVLRRQNTATTRVYSKVALPVIHQRAGRPLTYFKTVNVGIALIYIHLIHQDLLEYQCVLCCDHDHKLDCLPPLQRFFFWLLVKVLHKNL